MCRGRLICVKRTIAVVPKVIVPSEKTRAISPIQSFTGLSSPTHLQSDAGNKSFLRGQDSEHIAPHVVFGARRTNSIWSLHGLQHADLAGAEAESFIVTRDKHELTVGRLPNLARGVALRGYDGRGIVIMDHTT